MVVQEYSIKRVCEEDRGDRGGDLGAPGAFHLYVKVDSNSIKVQNRYQRMLSCRAICATKSSDCLLLRQPIHSENATERLHHGDSLQKVLVTSPLLSRPGNFWRIEEA